MKLNFGDKIKRLFSYIYPVSKTVHSPISGTLEVTWYNGKKILNAKNANYSYGSLQRILKFGLKQVDLSEIHSILILGMGGGSVIETLRKDLNYTGKIIAVDNDKTIIELAKNEFNVSPSENLEIECEDAYEYCKNSKDTFGLIIVDVFIDNMVPDVFYSVDFWKMMEKLTMKNGYVIFNASVNDPSKNKLETITENLKTDFQFQEHFKVEGTNTLLVGKKII